MFSVKLKELQGRRVDICVIHLSYQMTLACFLTQINGEHH